MATEITKVLKDEIATLRKPLLSFAGEFGRLMDKASDFAPRMMAAYGRFMAETQRTFVEFIRLIDPSVPMDRAGYTGHRTYQAGVYLKRKFDRRDRGANVTRPLRSNLYVAARLIATLLPLVRDHAAFWSGIATELQIKPRALAALKREAERVQPVIEVRAKPMDTARIIHMPTPEEREGEMAAAEGKKGRRQVAA